jgi:hypothetical protein
MHNVAFGSPWPSREKSVKRVIGDSDDEVGHKETDSPHGLTIEPLLKPAGGEDNFIRIMDMNDPPTDRYPPRGQ